ncbi:MAG: thiamine phosphate synthase [Terriglobales bacterium]|jgi:thiamine-phosphate pyrophosphorylase
MLLYYITDRTQFAGDDAARRSALLAKIGECARAGVDYIQLREKDLSGRELESVAEEALRQVRAAGSKTRLLVNSRTDIAIACGLDGVHLRSGEQDPSAGDARAIFASAGVSQPLIAASCHSESEVDMAESQAADFVVFAPVFEKSGGSGRGLSELRRICSKVSAADGKTEAVARARLPVLALGGVTIENAADCVRAGAAGVAGIRLFQKNEVAAVVSKLRAVK